MSWCLLVGHLACWCNTMNLSWSSSSSRSESSSVLDLVGSNCLCHNLKMIPCPLSPLKGRKSFPSIFLFIWLTYESYWSQWKINQSKKENFVKAKLRIITQGESLRKLWELFHLLEVKCTVRYIFKTKDHASNDMLMYYIKFNKDI